MPSGFYDDLELVGRRPLARTALAPPWVTPPVRRDPLEWSLACHNNTIHDAIRSSHFRKLDACVGSLPTSESPPARSKYPTVPVRSTTRSYPRSRPKLEIIEQGRLRRVHDVDFALLLSSPPRADAFHSAGHNVGITTCVPLPGVSFRRRKPGIIWVTTRIASSDCGGADHGPPIHRPRVDEVLETRPVRRTPEHPAPQSLAQSSGRPAPPCPRPISRSFHHETPADRAARLPRVRRWLSAVRTLRSASPPCAPSIAHRLRTSS